MLRRHGGGGLFLAAEENNLVWSHLHSTFHVAEWVPEACSLVGMTPSPHSYNDAKQEVTFTMTTFFRVYARSVMFRQALSSAFAHLKEKEFYIREFLVINDWYDGRSLGTNGTFTGPTVEETRREMVEFFPGCQGVTTSVAQHRPISARCTFVFKGAEERGQANALNVLLDLMVTKYWIHIEDDYVFYQDVYLSRFLEPLYEHEGGCWQQEHRVPVIVPELQGRALNPPPGVAAQLGGNASEAAGRHFGQLHLDGAAQSPRRSCQVIGGVQLGPTPALDSHDTYEVEGYRHLKLLQNLSYVKALLAHGGFDDKRHRWGSFQSVKAVDWPQFSLKPGLHNLTYIRSLEAPLFYGGRPGHFSEDPNMTQWTDGGKSYKFHWDFELEFAVRWARKGASVATLRPGACIRDVSNGISSYERSFEYR